MARRKKDLDSEWPSNGAEPTGDIDAEAFGQYVARAGEIMRQQKALGDRLKELCAEADEAGVASRSEVRRHARESLMKQDVLQARLERDAALRRALGEYITTPLGGAAARSAEAPGAL